MLSYPLFSALLTEDLEVISPTGIPLSHDYCEMESVTSGSNNLITTRLIETSMGVFLVREFSRGGVLLGSHSIVKPRDCLVIVKSSSRNICGGENMKLNVILE